MTFQTPLHVKRLRPIRDRHLVDLAVTGRAADAFRDMNAVIEIGKVRQIVHAVPAQRRILVEARAHWSEHRRFRPDLRVTRHAGVGGWDSGEGGFFDRGVAVTTIDAVIEHVMFMTERHGLRERHVHVSRVGRPKNRGGRPARPAKKQNETNNDDA